MGSGGEPWSSMSEALRRVGEALWEIPASARADMRVPARIFADEPILDAIRDDRSLEQLQNVATLPGIVDAALAMPDIHQGYGFPVGGIAATEVPGGVISPGGVGYDINCGVRLLAARSSANGARPWRTRSRAAPPLAPAETGACGFARGSSSGSCARAPAS
jgi:tRNA-splicing ligase RtcB (3'-phosphate/5'-hydroxy nucleic acid ligase)